MITSSCVYESTETAQSFGDDTRAMIAQSEEVWEHGLRTKCGPLRQWTESLTHRLTLQTRTRTNADIRPGLSCNVQTSRKTDKDIRKREERHRDRERDAQRDTRTHGETHGETQRYRETRRRDREGQRDGRTEGRRERERSEGGRRGTERGNERGGGGGVEEGAQQMVMDTSYSTSATTNQRATRNNRHRLNNKNFNYRGKKTEEHLVTFLLECIIYIYVVTPWTFLCAHLPCRSSYVWSRKSSRLDCSSRLVGLIWDSHIILKDTTSRRMPSADVTPDNLSWNADYLLDDGEYIYFSVVTEITTVARESVDNCSTKTLQRKQWSSFASW